MFELDLVVRITVLLVLMVIQSTIYIMSIKDNGLFACGEILDVHGLCGGYNLQWAWSSGYVAGSSAARFVLHNGRGFNQRMAKWGSER